MGEERTEKRQKKVKNLQFLKDTNRAAVIKEMAIKNARSRIELSNRLGLSRMAISGIVNDLIDQDYIDECAFEQEQEIPKKTGRNPVILKVSDRSINAVGVYIKRYEIHCVVSDIRGEIFYHDYEILPPEANNDTFLSILHELLDRAIEKNGDYYLAGIGIASIGPLDIYEKRLFYPPNFYHVGNVYFEKELKEKYGLPVFLDNDMNASALAEYYYGSNYQNKSLVYVGFSSGVGAGIITRDRLLHGSGGFAGEVGHISIDPNGPKCSCGQRGCVELFTSISNLLMITGTSSVKELIKVMEMPVRPLYVEKGINVCRDAVKTLLITLANMYDPDIILLGEIPDELTSIYLDGMEEYTNENMFHHGFKKIEVKISSLGEKSPYLGAASLVFQKVFSGELSLPISEKEVAK